MAVDKFLVQDVIDRILKYGSSYEEELKKLNEQFPINVHSKATNNEAVRVYPR